MHDIIFEDSGLFSNLKVTELLYHPPVHGLADDEELEFIELKNIGNTTLDLSGLAYNDGKQFTFPAGSNIAPGAFFVIASNKTEFFNFYKIQTNFEYSGSLSNSGETVVLQSASNQPVISFTYSDLIPWSVEADDLGYSLVAKQVNPTGNPDSPEYWTISKNINGSPVAKDPISTNVKTVLATATTQSFEIYPNPTNSAFYIDFKLETSDKVEILLYDLNGRLVETLFNEQMAGGFNSKYIQPARLKNSGIYVVALKKRTGVVTKKLVVQK